VGSPTAESHRELADANCRAHRFAVPGNADPATCSSLIGPERFRGGTSASEVGNM